MRTTIIVVASLLSGLFVQTPHAQAADPAPLDYTAVSMPDFTNVDVGDLTGKPNFDPGMDANSTSPSVEQSIDNILAEVKSYDPSNDVIIPGDTVEGRWGLDRHDTGYFGPVDTEADRQQAVRNAADTYYSHFANWFSSRNLTTYPTLGDHEIGDNPWGNENAYTQFKRRNLNLFKDEWANHLLGDRFPNRPPGEYAYATMLAPSVLLLSVDTFTPTSTTVENRVSDAQMTWLRAQLDAANSDGVKWILVQGHDPVLGPVRYRHSSHQMYQGGEGSPFWQLLKDEKVDLYLCGEVHDTTAIVRPGNPVQISHGGPINYGLTGFLVQHYTDAGATLTYRDWPDQTQSTANGYLWAADRDQLNPAIMNFPRESAVEGTMTLTPDGVVSGRSGILSEGQVVAVTGRNLVTQTINKSIREVKIDLYSNSITRQQIAGAGLRWKVRVDGRTERTWSQGPGEHNIRVRHFARNKKSHRVELYRNGVKVRNFLAKPFKASSR